jgi:regulatory protein
MPASRPNEPPNLQDGVVTAVRAQKRDPERVAVFIDGEFAFGLAADIAIREGLRKGMEVSAAAQALIGRVIRG